MTLAMSPAAQRAMARKWFIVGFRCSGTGFHGETRAAKAPAVDDLLGAEFERVWSEEE